MHPGRVTELHSTPALWSGESWLSSEQQDCWLQIVLGGLRSRMVWVPRAPTRKKEAQLSAASRADQLSDLRLLASARRGLGDSSDSWWVH